MDEQFTSEEQAALKEAEGGAPETVQEPQTQAAEPDQGAWDDDTGAETSAEADAGDADGAEQKKGDPNVALQSERQRLREERTTRRKLEAQLEQQQKAFAALSERIAQIGQRGPQGQQKPDPMEALNAQFVDEPDPFDDPEGNKAARAHNKKILEAQQHALRQFAEERNRTQQQTEQQRRVAAQRQQIRNIGYQHMQDFMIEAPDYSDAEQHLLQSRVAEYQAMGLTQEKISQEVHADIDRIIVHAHQTGGNAAQMIYNLAKLRGWGAQAQQGAPSAADHIAAKAQAAQQNRSLGSIPGAKSKGGLSAEKIASMSEDDIANMSDDEILQLAG